MINITTENYKDINQIAEITSLAFTDSDALNEVILIDGLRHRKEFDPELSLVATIDDKIVGHILFSPCMMNFNETLHKCAILAPLAVHPVYQKQGIGKQLIEEGHKRLIDKGFQMSILLGHPEYYPKFGYETHQFGEALIKIQNKDIKNSHELEVTERSLYFKDLDIINRLWELNFKETNLAIKPEMSMTSWVSCEKNTKSVILEKDEKIIGYIRYNSNHPLEISSILFNENKDDFINVLSHIKNKCADAKEIELPVDGTSQFIKNNLTIPYETINNVWPAGMIKILNKNNDAIMQYCQTVKNDPTKAGMVTWPIEFEIC